MNVFLTTLLSDLDKLQAQAGTTHDDLATLDGNLQTVDRKLQIVKSIDDKLIELDNLLVEVDDALNLVKIVPPISDVAVALDTEVKVLKGPVHIARLNADNIEAQIKPYRERLEATDKYVLNAENVAQILQKSAGETKTTVLQLANCIAGLKDGTPKHDLGRALDNGAKQVDPIVVLLTQTLAGLDGPVKIVNGIMVDANGIIDLGDLLDQIQKVIDVLSPIIGPLNDLINALSHRIGIGKFSFSIKEILNDLKLPWPFGYLVDKFMDKALTFLKPFLKALHLNIQLPSIPGLGVLNNLRVGDFTKLIDGINDCLSAIQDLVDKLSGLENQFLTDLHLFQLKCPPTADGAESP